MQDNSILEGFVFEADFARANKISRRTSANYRNEPNGLPYVMFGGKVYIHVERAKNWLDARIKRPNPRRRAA